jgi:hypothetical protein
VVTFWGRNFQPPQKNVVRVAINPASLSLSLWRIIKHTHTGKKKSYVTKWSRSPFF